MGKGRVVQFQIAEMPWCMLWKSGVCCGRVVCVVAEWCVLWPSGIVRKFGVTFSEIEPETDLNFFLFTK